MAKKQGKLKRSEVLKISISDPHVHGDELSMLAVITRETINRESRISPRVGLEIPVTLRQFNLESGITAEISNISRDGLGLCLPGTWANGRITKGDFLAFETSEFFFRIRGVGQVAWVLPDRARAGISFLDLDGAQAKLLEQFLLLCI